MSATLSIVAGGEQQTYDCGNVVTLGRTETNDIPVPDPKVSRNHALVRFLGDGKYYIMDLGSANGTFVNENRIVTPFALNSGDRLRLGNHTFVFQQEVVTQHGAETDNALNSQETVLSMQGQVQRITVLVADIRGYSSMSDVTPVNIMASMLGCWFRAANEIIEKNGGVVDKFIGDAIMARWLTGPGGHKSSIRLALHAAHDLNLASEAVSQDFSTLPSPIRIGVGINTGQAVLGNVGSVSARDYTALGDSVNLAFRFESATKELKKDLVIGIDSYKYLPEPLWTDHQQSVMVKGKDMPIDVCALTFGELVGWLPDVLDTQA